MSVSKIHWLRSGRLIGAVTVLLALPALASQPESNWEALTEADVARVVTTLGALVEAAEDAGTATRPTDIEVSGRAAEILWAVEEAVAAADRTDRRNSETLRDLLLAGGYETEPEYILEMWKHYALRVLELHDAIRLGYFERDLGGEWQVLYTASQGGLSETQTEQLLEIDRAARIVATSRGDRAAVEAYSGRLEELRQQIAAWPERPGR